MVPSRWSTHVYVQAMPIALHLTFTTSALHGHDAAGDLLARAQWESDPSQLWEHRVVEFSPSYSPGGARDLTLDEASMPELLSVLHEASQVHLYGVEVEGLLQWLPYVRPDALAEVPLHVHGPCVQAPPQVDTGPARLESWPGPVSYDRPAALSLGMAFEEEREADQIPLDPHAASLWPRQGDAGPVPGLAEDNAVIVSVSRAIPEAISEALCERVESFFSERGDGVDVGWILESTLTPTQARAHRRLAQLCIAGSWEDPICLEALLARTPLWVLDDAESPLLDWLRSMGISPELHHLALPETPEFEARWKASIQQWAQGEALEAPEELREVVLARCVGQA